MSRADGGGDLPVLTYPEIAVIYKAMAKSLFYKPLAILIIEESYLQRFFHTLAFYHYYLLTNIPFIFTFSRSSSSNFFTNCKSSCHLLIATSYFD